MAYGRGINEDKIPATIEAINNYKNEVKNRLDAAKSSIDLSTAFIGSAQSAALNDYYATLMDRIYETFSFLDSFGTTVEQVVEQYRETESGIAEAVNTAAKAPVNDGN